MSIFAAPLRFGFFSQPMAVLPVAPERETIVAEQSPAAVLSATVLDRSRAGCHGADVERILRRFETMADVRGFRGVRTGDHRFQIVCDIACSGNLKLLADLALAMQREMANIAGCMAPMSLRIGLHLSDVADESVRDVASQLEAHGLCGGIHVSAAAHEELHDSFFFEPRGEFYIKGEGEVETYLLHGRRPVATLR